MPKKLDPRSRKTKLEADAEASVMTELLTPAANAVLAPEGSASNHVAYVRVAEDGMSSGWFLDPAGESPLPGGELRTVLETTLFRPAVLAGQAVESCIPVLVTTKP